MAETFLLKNIFTKKMVQYIASNIKAVYPFLKNEMFIKDVVEAFEPLSLTQRAEHISAMLYEYLPSPYLKSLDIIVKSLGPVTAEEELEGYDSFYIMPLGIFVKDYGLGEFDASMLALKEMTMRFTSEFAVRHFIVQDEETCLLYFRQWLKDENCHVRRLVSEGTRPRLPWGLRLQKYVKDPGAVLKLLHAMKNEPTRLVQRSIANSLNDISKDNPSLVTDFLEQWKDEGVKDCDWIISHACRTLIKQGDKQALSLMGFKSEVKIKELQLTISEYKIVIGEYLEFSLDFVLEEEAKLMIDYVIYFKKANGELKPKVFKFSNKSYKSSKISLLKRHRIKLATTRKYYEGIQKVSVQINGKEYTPKQDFFLKL